VIDLEESDKETIHLLVFLLMQFMSRADLAYPTDEKPMAKVQSIVLKHVYLLLGYSHAEKNFFNPPARMRTSAVFNVFLSNLPQVLDQNHLMGWTIVHVGIQVLLYCPNPSNTLMMVNTDSIQGISYQYSLWCLEPLARRNWLMSVLIILYKYQYTQPPFTQYVQHLIRIILNSLNAHFHQCKKIPANVVMEYPTFRTRDLSQPSLGTEGDSPPPSPLFPSDGGPSNTASRSKQQVVTPNKSQTSRKHPDSSLEVDDTESELVAIPESDDSTLHGSAQGSFDDTLHFDDYCAPLRPEIMKNRATAHVITANLATAQVAMSTLVATERIEERSETSKKVHKIVVTSNNSERKTGDTRILQSTTTTTVEAISTVTSQIKQQCSVQEGVRMMVTSSMLGQPKAQAVLNPPANVQKAIVVTQNTTSVKNAQTNMTGKMICNIASNQLKTIGAMGGVAGSGGGGELKKQQSLDMPVTRTSRDSSPKEKPKALVSPNSASISNWIETQVMSPTHRPLGRQKRIIGEYKC
jgi:protein unc-79